MSSRQYTCIRAISNSATISACTGWEDCPGYLLSKVFPILGLVTGEAFGSGLLTFQVNTSLDCQCPATSSVRVERGVSHSVCSATHLCLYK